MIQTVTNDGINDTDTGNKTDGLGKEEQKTELQAKFEKIETVLESRK